MSVVTANSGVGFVALLAPRPVITCARSDYGIATFVAKYINQLSVGMTSALTEMHSIKSEDVASFLSLFLRDSCFQYPETIDRLLKTMTSGRSKTR